jgi:Na+-translocating ferredoxin:NAD+ oxidoreductase RnfC subunit
MLKNKVAELARWAGVVGAGGAGFPTHVKLNATVDVVIVNGAECEPLISVDQNLMLNYASQLTTMLESVRQDLKAKTAIFALKGKHKEAVATLKAAVTSHRNLQLKWEIFILPETNLSLFTRC